MFKGIKIKIFNKDKYYLNNIIIFNINLLLYFK